MQIGILGTGDVGRTLGAAFITLGHDVRLGSRSATNDKARNWAQQVGPRGSTGTFGDAVAFGDIVVLATLGTATEDAIRLAGPQRFAGKVVIDATNPLEHRPNAPPELAIGFRDSLGERVQRLLPDAKVVKAFNTVGNTHMFRPQFRGGPPDMFICGNDDGAKRTVTEFLTAFGWGTVDIGDIQGARYLEPMCMAWVRYGLKSGTWNHAFKLLRR
ncbi:MAG TPA: NAD(P)-binding domain-containing protein [Gemmatimonadales bacterium]